MCRSGSFPGCAGISDTPFALADPAALAAQAEALVGKPEGFALLDTTGEAVSYTHLTHGQS